MPLPLLWQIKIGKYLGRLFRHVSGKSSRTAKKNLEIFFPELSDIARKKLLQHHFEALGASLFEMSNYFSRKGHGLKRWIDNSPFPVTTEREAYVIKKKLPIYRSLYIRTSQYLQ